MNFIVYSKNNCPYCYKVKQVLELTGSDFETQILDKDFTREEFYAKFGDGATFPQVMLDDLHLGGCQESIKHMQKEKLCCQV